MQNRYAGDIGDYLKLALLRTLWPGHTLGVAWWLVPDETHNTDGRHVGYLENPDNWRLLDPDVFDGLGELVRSGKRTVADLEQLPALDGCRFASDPLPIPKLYSERPKARSDWFRRTLGAMNGCDLVFVDPDNGLEPDRFSPQSAKSIKCVRIDELRELANPERCVIAYHHQTRRKGGHKSEISHLAERLRKHGFKSVDTLRARPFSPRAFLLLNASAPITERASELAERHPTIFSWHPDSAALPQT